MFARRVEDVAKAADVDVVEVQRAGPPDADERGAVDDRVDLARGREHGRAIAHVAAGRSRERHGIVSARGERAANRAAEISGTARDENAHAAILAARAVAVATAGRP